MKKTDNSNLYAKLDLRRYFLSKYFKGKEIKVLDCCQGNGIIWKKLCNDYPIASYWGVDMKKQKGRLSIQSERILCQPGWKENVIDIDTYGSPWKHWFAMLPNISQFTVVFLTVGLIRIGGGGGIDRLVLKALSADILDLPSSLIAQLNELSISYCLKEAQKHNLEIKECLRADVPGNATYIGMAILPQKTVNLVKSP